MGQHAHQIEVEPRTIHEFLDAYEGVPGLYEFVDGKVLETMMTHNTHAHGRMMFTIGGKLLALSPKYDVVMEGGVKTSRGLRFPDILVVESGGDPKARFTERPVAVVEVLSPSTADQDFGPKVREYLAFDTLRHYLIVGQIEAEAWLWTRNDKGEWPEKATFLEGDDAEVELSAFDLTFPLADLY